MRFWCWTLFISFLALYLRSATCQSNSIHACSLGSPCANSIGLCQSPPGQCSISTVGETCMCPSSLLWNEVDRGNQNQEVTIENEHVSPAEGSTLHFDVINSAESNGIYLTFSFDFPHQRPSSVVLLADLETLDLLINGSSKSDAQLWYVSKDSTRILEIPRTSGLSEHKMEFTSENDELRFGTYHFAVVDFNPDHGGWSIHLTLNNPISNLILTLLIPLAIVACILPCCLGAVAFCVFKNRDAKTLFAFCVPKAATSFKNVTLGGEFLSISTSFIFDSIFLLFKSLINIAMLNLAFQSVFDGVVSVVDFDWSFQIPFLPGILDFLDSLLSVSFTFGVDPACRGVFGMIAFIIITLTAYVVIFLLFFKVLFYFALSFERLAEGSAPMVQRAYSKTGAFASQFCFYLLQLGLLRMVFLYKELGDEAPEGGCSAFDRKMNGIFITNGWALAGMWWFVTAIIIFVAILMPTNLQTMWGIVKGGKNIKGCIFRVGMLAITSLVCSVGVYFPGIENILEICALSGQFAGTHRRSGDDPVLKTLQVHARVKSLIWLIHPAVLVVTKISEVMNENPVIILDADLREAIKTKLTTRAFKWTIGMILLIIQIVCAFKPSEPAFIALFLGVLGSSGTSAILKVVHALGIGKMVDDSTIDSPEEDDIQEDDVESGKEEGEMELGEGGEEEAKIEPDEEEEKKAQD